MTLAQLLKDTALSLSAHLKIKDVRIGLCYTAVQLEDGHTGLAYTFRDQLAAGCTPLTTYRPLAGMAASQLVAQLDSSQPITAAVALATVNALCNRTNQNYLPGPALDQLSLNPDDQVGMVGNFTPLINEIRPRVGRLYIFERQPRPQENILGNDKAELLLPQCQVAVITATTLINHSIDRLLELTHACREVVILGTSTPLVGQLLAQTPITRLSGVVVKKPQEVLRIVSEGGGTPDFKPATEKVNLIQQADG